MHTCTYECARMHACMFASASTRMHVCMCACAYAYVHVYVCMRMPMCVYKCMCVCAYACPPKQGRCGRVARHSRHPESAKPKAQRLRMENSYKDQRKNVSAVPLAFAHVCPRMAEHIQQDSYKDRRKSLAAADYSDGLQKENSAQHSEPRRIAHSFERLRWIPPETDRACT